MNAFEQPVNQAEDNNAEDTNAELNGHPRAPITTVTTITTTQHLQVEGQKCPLPCVEARCPTRSSFIVLAIQE